ncbi:MAG: hypothetical protein ACKVJK_00845 [Methylophagaceae bacterium]|jgi:hypothetical protein|tara:strand:+ start:7978 stop:8136 length:159 start_codon:yes stop_codon:yes gene_type:complete
MTYAMVWCVEWYDKNDHRQIQWNVRDPEQFKRELIAQNIAEDKIEIYEKDVS